MLRNVEEKKEEEAEKIVTPPPPPEHKESPKKGGRGASPKPTKQIKGSKNVVASPISADDRPSSVAESTGSAIKNPVLTSHRWIIAPESTITLRIRFTSSELGIFDEVLLQIFLYFLNIPFLDLSNTLA